VRDVVRAYHVLLEQGKVGETYNISSGKAQPLRWIVEEMIRRTGIDIEIRSDTKLERSVDIPLLVGSNAKIAADTGWKPEIELTDTLKDLIDYWMKKLGD